MTKLMTFAVLQDAIARGALTLQTRVTVVTADTRAAPSIIGLKKDEIFPLEELIYAMMLPSANDAALAVAREVAGSVPEFVPLMNAKARALGMNHTTFRSPNGLPPPSHRVADGDLTTPRDFALLCRYLLVHTDILKYTSVKTRLFGVGYRFPPSPMTNHNHLLGRIEGVDGLKTGFTNSAGSCLAATALRNNRRIIVVMMDSPDAKERDLKVAELLQRGFATPPAFGSEVSPWAGDPGGRSRGGPGRARGGARPERPAHPAGRGRIAPAPPIQPPALSAHHILSFRDVTVTYGRARGGPPALEDVTVDFPCGSLTAILGPNGAGKSTLLRAVLGWMPLARGEIRIGDAHREHALPRLAYLPHRHVIDWDFPITVRSVVEQGRYPALRPWQRLRADDHERVERALAELDLTGVADRQIRRLSGGQQQRVFLARAVAQGAAIVLLDEPFAGLDLFAVEELTHILRSWEAQGRTVLAAVHGLDLARRVFARGVLVATRLIAAGPLETVLTEANVDLAFRRAHCVHGEAAHHGSGGLSA